MAIMSAILTEARLTIEQHDWTASVMDQLVPKEGRPMLTPTTLPYLTWEAMEPALKIWREMTMDPTCLDAINKVEAAAKKLGVRDDINNH